MHLLAGQLPLLLVEVRHFQCSAEELVLLLQRLLSRHQLLLCLLALLCLLLTR